MRVYFASLAPISLAANLGGVLAFMELDYRLNWRRLTLGKRTEARARAGQRNRPPRCSLGHDAKCAVAGEREELVVRSVAANERVLD